MTTYLTRKEIDLYVEKDAIKLTDSNDRLDMFCVVNPEIDTHLNSCRGVVYNKEGQLVLQAFPYTITTSEEHLFKEHVEKIFDQCSFYDSYEGFLIRMWSSNVSFGDMFVDALMYEFSNNDTLVLSMPEINSVSILEHFQTMLQPDHQYMFLVRNTKETRIVCDAPDNPSMFHVGTFKGSELDIDANLFNIPKPKKLKFETIEEVCRYADNSDYTKTQGVIVFAPNNQQYKLLSHDYELSFEVRGNVPSIKFRYLQLRNDREMKEAIEKLYPEKVPEFQEYEMELLEISQHAYNLYYNRHIRKQHIEMTPKVKSLLYQVHGKYLNAKYSPERMSICVNQQDVLDTINEQDPSFVNHLLREYRELKKNVDM